MIVSSVNTASSLPVCVYLYINRLGGRSLSLDNYTRLRATVLPKHRQHRSEMSRLHEGVYVFSTVACTCPSSFRGRALAPRVCASLAPFLELPLLSGLALCALLCHGDEIRLSSNRTSFPPSVHQDAGRSIREQGIAFVQWSFRFARELEPGLFLGKRVEWAKHLRRKPMACASAVRMRTCAKHEHARTERCVCK